MGGFWNVSFQLQICITVFLYIELNTHRRISLQSCFSDFQSSVINQKQLITGFGSLNQRWMPRTGAMLTLRRI